MNLSSGHWGKQVSCYPSKFICFLQTISDFDFLFLTYFELTRNEIGYIFWYLIYFKLKFSLFLFILTFLFFLNVYSLLKYVFLKDKFYIFF